MLFGLGWRALCGAASRAAPGHANPRCLGGAQEVPHRSAGRVHPRRGNEVRHILDHSDGPIIAVQYPVVSAAEEHQISQVSAATVVPVFDMVRLRPFRRDIAAGKGATEVAGDERVALVALHQTVGVADIQGL